MVNDSVMELEEALRRAIEDHMKDARLAAHRAPTVIDRRAHCEVEYRLSLWLKEVGGKRRKRRTKQPEPEAEPAPAP